MAKIQTLEAVDAWAWDLMWRGRPCVPDCTCYHHLPGLHQISLPWSVRIPSQIKPTMSVVTLVIIDHLKDDEGDIVGLI